MHRRDESKIENRKSKIELGFTLIEAAVAIGVVAILAGAIAPLAVKAINQQREARTRDSLKACFEGMFGARDRRVANMRADFGFNPGTALADLSGMVAKGLTGVSATVPDYAQASGSIFWGYNGPYWNGSVDGANRPTDGWGRPMQLRWVGGGWQVFSLGSDGANNSAASTPPLGDDLAYPIVPAVPTSFKAVLYIHVTNAAALTAIAVVDRNATNSLSAVNVYENGGGVATPLNPAGVSTHNFICNPVAGGVRVTLTRASGDLIFAFDLLPGEVKTVDVAL
jgi:type II secretory pathway pseudopilin PulG